MLEALKAKWAAVKVKLAAIWKTSQVRAVAIIHALSGASLVVASAVSDGGVKESLSSVMSPTVLGFVALGSAIVIYLATPHEK